MNQLRSLRLSRALTYLDLAALSGIPARLIAEAELGLRSLTGQQYSQLALVLGVGTQRLVEPVARQQTASLPTIRQIKPFPPALAALAVAGTLATSLSVAQNVPVWSLALPASGTVGAPAEPLRAAGSAGGALRSALMMSGVEAQPEDEAPSLATSANTLPVAAPAPTAQPQSPQLLVAALPPPEPIPLPPAQSAPQSQRFVLSERGPLGCPVTPSQGRVVMTQGYGVGSHAPAATWGAIDLAVDGDGDGYAEPAASWYTPIVATHDGVVTVTLDSYPGGNHVWVRSNDTPWRTGYAHLALVTVISGQYVRAGDVIGMLGSSGMSSGPHLDYQVWNGSVNVDPTELVGC
jgi:transcriptional regulator with XRE-family HTH domain